ncbi:hypothetical protein [Flavobacterium sp. HSC-61S13]|uniref:hypothetical protein n=1 Tax=Flavobacterium sp. HSC-61S13 TaxID=2910963 RepID=UPI0020A0BC95|nr:hypothetical protein [Flavobacterium sp. HSC-61S13]MCP1997438.1 hypothetical protein [Flavobacterium sp. HSC-61S13]
MKKVLFGLFGVLFFISCSSDSENTVDSKEDVYLKTNLSKILNLSESDRSDFKKTMVFDSNGKLSSWNIDLLEKAYVNEEDFTNIFSFLVSDLGGDTSKIIIVDENNNERVLYPKSKRLNNKKILSRGDHMTDDADTGGTGTITYKDYIKHQSTGDCMKYIGHSCTRTY